MLKLYEHTYGEDQRLTFFVMTNQFIVEVSPGMNRAGIRASSQKDKDLALGPDRPRNVPFVTIDHVLVTFFFNGR